eukprot:15034977-Ditylum_brightwellii.AAC.1
MQHNSNTVATPSFMRHHHQQQQKKTLEVQINMWYCLEVSGGGSGLNEEEMYGRDYGTPGKA